MNEKQNLIDELAAIFGDEETKGPGRGHKQCPKCKKYVGVRTQTCECGNNFTKTGSYKTKDKFDDISLQYREECRKFAVAVGADEHKVIYAATGICPIKLFGELTQGKVFDWCDNILEYGLNHNMLYSKMAIDGFAASFINRETNTWKLYEQHSKEWYDGIILAE